MIHSRPTNHQTPTCCGARQALSLLEILLAVVVMVMAIIPISGLLSTANRQIHQTGDYSLGILLADRTAEELRLANWENPHLGDHLKMDPDYGRAIPVTDGKSRFYRTIEDSQEPHGLLQPGKDQTVDKTLQPLFHFVNDYTVTFATVQRTLPETGVVVDLSLDTAWKDGGQVRRGIDLPVTLGRLSPNDTIPPGLVDRQGADEAIGTLFYPDRPGSPLNQIVAATGANLRTVRWLGDLVIIAQSLQASEPDHRSGVADLSRLLTEAVTPYNKAQVQIAVARAYERRAATYLQAMAYLAPGLSAVEANFKLEDLGDPPPPYAAWGMAPYTLPTIIQQFDYQLAMAESEALRAFASPVGDALPLRVRMKIFKKAIDLHRLRVLSTGPRDVALLKEMLTQFRDFHQGRNQNLAEFADHELTLADTPQSMEAFYPHPVWLSAYTTTKTLNPRLGQRIQEAFRQWQGR